MTGVQTCALPIYRTGFNGLFRLNSRGDFNVPVGRYTNPRICDPAHLHAVARAFRSPQVSLECGSFERPLAERLLLARRRLRPGIAGTSENITVTSILGRFLEHARVFYFLNDGAESEYYIGSADSFARREWQHKYDLRRGVHKNPRLQAAWNKYGEEMFVFEVLEEIPAEQSQLQVEDMWLAQHVGQIGRAHV